MIIEKKMFSRLIEILKQDQKSVFYLIYYSLIEAVLLLTIPLTATFIINSILAHAQLSVFVLGFIVVIAFLLVLFLKILQESVVEHFQQKIFVNTGIRIMELTCELKDKSSTGEASVEDKKALDKYMNYFFDVLSIQKVIPAVLLEGSGLVMKIIASLVLLFIFNHTLFISGLLIFALYLFLLAYLGKGGVDFAIKRSDAKHKSIYYLQHTFESDRPRQEILQTFDQHLNEFVIARKNSFKVIIRQLSLTFFVEGFIVSGFLILGGYLVINGSLPIGEFVAAEIIVVSIGYALKSFVKQIDYVYEMIESFYKLDKLSGTLGDKLK